ncbi:hypothetical protein LCGC14_2167210 [marine sediment metagenome]|uniref:Uncharacterized protein n=1 Tax=marine sediment metagenome TaxID=412755 RepID=A0A0F9GM33_9ZZZZ
MAQTPALFVKPGLALAYLSTSDKIAGEVVVIGTRPLIVSHAIDFSLNPIGTVVSDGVWGIPQAAEYIDTATMEVLRQVEGKSPDEVMALLNPDDKEQDPSSDRGEGGDDEAGSEGGVPDTHVLDPFHEGEGEAQQIHKKTFNQYIRKTYPERDLNEAREAVGLPAMKED